MFDLAQFLLVLVITTLTVLLVIIGLQVVNILREFRRSLEKINKILDDAGLISSSVAKPLADFSGFFEGVKGGLKIIESLLDFFKNRKKKREEKKKKETTEQEENKPEPQEEEKKELKEEKPSPRRFFFRRGRKLV